MPEYHAILGNDPYLTTEVLRSWPASLACPGCRTNKCTDIFFLCLLCLQHTSLSPDGKFLVIVGDNPEGILVDSQTGKVPFFLT